MAQEKGKILKVDVEAKKVLIKTIISEGDRKTYPEWDGGAKEVETFVEFDFTTCGEEWLLREAARHLRIEVRRAHLVPMGPEKCAETSEDKPFQVSAENASTSGKPRSAKLEDKSAEELQALIKRAQELLKAKQA